MADELEAAIKNGYDPKKVFDEGMSVARTVYYAAFFKAVENNNVKEMDKNANRLIMLDGTLKALKQSVRAKYKKDLDIVDIPYHRSKAIHDSWIKGWNKARREKAPYADKFFNYD